jgi:hypothetical protein
MVKKLAKVVKSCQKIIKFDPTTLVQKNLLNELFVYVFKQMKQHIRVKQS